MEDVEFLTWMVFRVIFYQASHFTFFFDFDQVCQCIASWPASLTTSPSWTTWISSTCPLCIWVTQVCMKYHLANGVARCNTFWIGIRRLFVHKVAFLSAFHA